MAEWFKALVLKTSDVARHRGFESLSLRQYQPVEKYPRGRRGSPAKGVGWDNCREGSNPSFSAKTPENTAFSGVFHALAHLENYIALFRAPWVYYLHYYLHINFKTKHKNTLLPRLGSRVNISPLYT